MSPVNANKEIKNKENIMNAKLQECLSLIGNNPIQEKDLFDILSEQPLVKSKAVKLALKKAKLNIKDFTANEIAEFFSDLSDKIFSTKDENGNFKTTPNTENYQLPNFEEHEQLMSLLQKMHNTKVDFESKILQKETSQDEIERLSNEIGNTLKELDDLVWSITGLDKASLTEWEQKLVAEQIFEGAINIEQTSMGKLLKR